MVTNVNKQRARGRKVIILQRVSGPKDGYACISGLAYTCERPPYEQCTAAQSIIATQRRKTRLQIKQPPGTDRLIDSIK